MAINITDFDKIWASTSPLTPYSFTDANYQEGWNFIGSTPPARQMWDFLQKNNDEKAQFLADAMFKGNPLTLTADDGNGNSVSLVGNPNGSITWNGKQIERVNASGTDYIRYESGLQICWGTGSTSSGIHQYTFPVAFSAKPFVSLTVASAENSDGYFCKIADLTTTGVKALTMTANSTYTQLRTYYIAVGYWK